MAHTPAFRQLLALLGRHRHPTPATAAANCRLTRRRIVHTAAVAAAAGLAPGLKACHGNRPVAIIGAGIAGLSAAHHLRHLRPPPIVYEASDRPGGRIRSETGALAPDLTVDLGASYISRGHHDVLNLIDHFGLPLFDIPAHLESQPLPTSAFLLDGQIQDQAGLARALTPLARQIGTDAARLDEDWALWADRFDQISVATYLDRHSDKLPNRAVRSLVVAVIRSEYGVEISESSMVQLLFERPSATPDGQVDPIAGNAETWLVRGGCQRLTDSMAARLGRRLHTGRRLVALDAIGNQDSLGYRLSFADGTQTEADHVILAIPTAALKAIDLRLDLPLRLAEFIAEVRLGSNEKLFAGFAHRPWRRPGGFADSVWSDGGFSVAWDESLRRPERSDGILTFFHGGRETALLSVDGADRRGPALVNHLEAVWSGFAADATGRFQRTGWSQRAGLEGAYTSFRPGQFTRFADIMWTEADDGSPGQQARAGNVFFVGEHLSENYYGFMNGSAQTGRLASAAILSEMAR